MHQIALVSVLRNRNVALLWSSGLISGLGDAVLRLSLPYYVYGHTGSMLATSALLAASLLPGLAMI
jgi:hypothetical protein